jgi:hypothetical protein
MFHQRLGNLQFQEWDRPVRHQNHMVVVFTACMRIAAALSYVTRIIKLGQCEACRIPHRGQSLAA